MVFKMPALSTGSALQLLISAGKYSVYVHIYGYCISSLEMHLFT